MSGLPSGWESDYNGSRWFYRYKPTGQIQFHFPQDGDEFPDFVDANAPAPDLAPEEKLESQQQVKRKTEPSENNEKGPAKSLTRATAGPSGGGLGSGTKPSRTAAGKQQLSPTDDDDNGGEFYYQPESFMFLGPGAYSDVSPLGEEDDRVDAGAKPPEKGRRNEDENAQVKSEDSQPSRLSSKVSPIQSESTTPLVVHGTPVAGDSPAAKPSVETTQPAAVVEPPSATSPTVPLLDSREMPHELPASSPWSPVGVVAEMPTEHTAQARIESHPDPVEMGDSAVLAPIETHMDVGIAELPEHTTPTDRKPVDTSQHDELQQTSLPDHVLYQATFGTIARPKNPSPPSLAQQTAGASTPAEASTRSHERQIQAAEEPRAPRNESPFRITRKPTNAATSSSKYQPYAPPVAASTAERPHLEQRTSSSQSQDRRGSLIREGSLMLGPREPARVQSADVPTVLQPPQLPPKVEEQPRSHPSQAPVGSNTVPHHTAFAAREQTRAQENESGASSERAAPASLSHVPSVLKPARGKMIERSSTDNQRGHTDNPPRIGQIHHTTTMDVDPQPALGPRPWVQRVSTAPPGQQLHPSSSTSRTNDFSIPSPPPPRSYEASQSRDWSSASLAYQRQEVSTPQGRLPRQQSFASSDVSSLGPSSSRQSSISNFQTQSPPESLQRRSSNISGFFADVNLGEERSTNPPSASRVVATEPFPSYAPPVREPVTRPASFAGSSSSPTHIPQDASDGTAPKPPKIPLKIPLEHKTDKVNNALSSPAGKTIGSSNVQWPVGQQLPNASASLQRPPNDVQRRGTTRRHSMPQEQTPPPQQHLDLSYSSHGVVGEGALPHPLGKPQDQNPPSAPFHWTIPGLGSRSNSQPSTHDSGIRRVGSFAPEMASMEPTREPTRPSERPQRPLAGTNAQQPSRSNALISVPTPGHALLPIQEQPESDQGRSSSQPVIPISRQLPIPLPQPGQFDRAATTLPVLQQPPPQVHPVITADHGRQTATVLSAQKPGMQSQGTLPKVGSQQYVMMEPPPPLQHHQRSYSSPLGVIGPVVDKEKEKERGGWFSKFKKGSQKSAVLQKQPYPAAQMQHFQVVPQQVQQQPLQPQRHSEEEMLPQHHQNMPFNAQSIGQTPHSQKNAAQSQPGPVWGVDPHTVDLPAATQVRVPDQQGLLVRSSSDTIRESSAVPPTTLKTEVAQSQALAAAASDVSRTSSHSYAPLLDRQASVASSYAASISTVDIAEAYAQPIMKPQLITVQRVTTAPLQLSSQQQPRENAGPSLVWSEESQGYFPAQQVRQEVSPPHVAQPPAAAGQLAPSPYIASNHQNVGATGSSTQPPPPQRGNSKWTKRPAADYSGGDWGDDTWK
ncbi:uncharacterized protein VDAG_05046 [Verticillium dahliae VdLs.17]|uniref:WW domain-containing protein n=2 Tax=Verticillium dahliae TaxID=27337 RepID=G2X4G4_VERDV|nr:uncharacterized protein VDAG_05046 [Verticillium dahliae VdLs.17]EGY23608.1 hypothetical protein VDAG_05046 [Verticillium dahliae VdLs.17]KAH6693198.1 hypothetical protein EV126DRAFT_87754 [Verticillium dahliae]